MGGRRFHNTYDFKEYIEEKVKPLDMELLSDEEKEEEFMFMEMCIRDRPYPCSLRRLRCRTV